MRVFELACVQFLVLISARCHCTPYEKFERADVQSTSLGRAFLVCEKPCNIECYGRNTTKQIEGGERERPGALKDEA